LKVPFSIDIKDVELDAIEAFLTEVKTPSRFPLQYQLNTVRRVLIRMYLHEKKDTNRCTGSVTDNDLKDIEVFIRRYKPCVPVGVFKSRGSRVIDVLEKIVGASQEYSCPQTNKNTVVGIQRTAST